MPAPRHAPVTNIGAYQPLHITATGTMKPVGQVVDTTAPDTIPGGAAATITPASMNGIVAGAALYVSGGTGAAERVTVTATTATTMTAVFANPHSGAYHLTSTRGSYLGKLVINKAGTSDVITLYNGSTNNPTPAGAAIAIITSPVAGQTYNYECACDYGLFYTVSGTPGDYTLLYADTPLGA